MEADQALTDFNRALLTLEGLIYGITSDEIVNQKELEKLKNWKKLHYDVIRHHPVGELVQILDSAMDCQILQDNEITFIQDFCQQYGRCEEQTDPYSCDIIRMRGFLRGILADGKIYKREMTSFRSWLNDRPHLKKYEKYDELCKKIHQFLDEKSLNREDLFDYLDDLTAVP